MKMLVIVAVLLCALKMDSNAQRQEQAENKCCCSTYDTGQCLIKVKKGLDSELEDTYQKGSREVA